MPIGDEHYARLNPQPIDVAEAWQLDHHCATVLKYLARAGHKAGNPLEQDLEKAIFYLERRIALEKAKVATTQDAEHKCEGGTFCNKPAKRMMDGRWFCRPHGAKANYCRECKRKVTALIAGLCKSCSRRNNNG